jgi:hypothetical protein
MQIVMYQTQQKTQTLILQFRMSVKFIKGLLKQQINELEEETVELKTKLAAGRTYAQKKETTRTAQLELKQNVALQHSHEIQQGVLTFL